MLSSSLSMMSPQRGGKKCSTNNAVAYTFFSRARFPMKLRTVLEDAAMAGNEHIISWLPSGVAFKVHKPDLFASCLMKRYFRQSHFRSFTRQLYHYGFERCEQGAFRHPLFKQDDVLLSCGMGRKVKGKNAGFKATRIITNQNQSTFRTLASSPSPTKQLFDDNASHEPYDIDPFSFSFDNHDINNTFWDPLFISTALSKKFQPTAMPMDFVNETITTATDVTALLFEPRSIEQMSADPLRVDALGEMTPSWATQHV